MFSPLSKGLFRRAILQSGASTHIFGLKEDAKIVTNMLIEALECDKQKDVFSCMRSKQPDDLLWALPVMTLSLFDEGVVYVIMF